MKEIRSAYMQGVSAKSLKEGGLYNKANIDITYSEMRTGGYVFGSNPDGWDKSLLPTGMVKKAMYSSHNHLVVEGGKKREAPPKKERDPLQGMRKALSKAKEQGIAKEALLAEIDALYHNVLPYRDGGVVSTCDPCGSDLPDVLRGLLKTGEHHEPGRVSVTSVLEALNEEETEPICETGVEDLVGREVKFKVGAVPRTGRIVSLEEEGGEYVFNVKDGKERNFKLTQDKLTLINE